MKILKSPGVTACRYRMLAIVVSGMLAAPAAPAEQDPYLQTLEGEVDKLEPNGVGEESASTSTPESRQEATLVRDRFESMLQQRYAGTYSFYTRLPERSRQEIVGEYRHGADIRQLRQMIIDRFYGSK